LVTPVPLSPLLLLCCAYGGGSIKISLQAMPYNDSTQFYVIPCFFQKIREIQVQKSVKSFSLTCCSYSIL
jgi:hypothetical protein